MIWTLCTVRVKLSASLALTFDEETLRCTLSIAPSFILDVAVSALCASGATRSALATVSYAVATRKADSTCDVIPFCALVTNV